jgi:hypothetical protein
MLKGFRPEAKTFNSGVLYICLPSEEKSSFAAVKNQVRAADLNKILKLNYDEKSRRESDMEFAESRDRTLNLKVRTRLREVVNSTHKVLIGKTLYSIIYIDPDRAAGEMYLYLEEERKVQ